MIHIQKGVRQGCIVSLDLFNLYSEEARRKLRIFDGVDLDGMNYANVRYADDRALIADGEEKLQRLFEILRR